jgi:hypothetical protein
MLAGSDSRGQAALLDKSGAGETQTELRSPAKSLWQKLLALVGLGGRGQGGKAATSGGWLSSRAAPANESSFDATRPITPLDPDRLALSSANSVTARIRDSQRLETGPAPPPHQA